MTKILEIVTEYLEYYVDDIRLLEQKAVDPPLYARRMWGFLNAAIPLFTIPSTMQDHLLGTEENPKLTKPLYDSTTFTVDITQTAPFAVSLGTEYAGYELSCCQVKTTDSFGNTLLLPIGYTYNAENGTFLIDASEENPVNAGSILDFDFYTDGEFTENLSPEVKRILSLCFEWVWVNRFNTDWLSNVSKVEDKTFFEQNRANKMRADTERLKAVKEELSTAMRRFSQNKEIRKVVPPSAWV